MNKSSAVKNDMAYRMIGGSTGATAGDKKNESNGVGTDVTVNIGLGFNIFTQGEGKTNKEMMTMGGILDHELVHGLAMLNGETVENKGSTTVSFMNDRGRMQTEKIEKEEYITTMGYRPSLRNLPNYRYPNENQLRLEQGLRPRVNYLPAK